MKSKVSELAAYNELIILFSLNKLERVSTSEDIFIYASNFFDFMVISKAIIDATLGRMVKKGTICIIGKTNKRLIRGGKRRKKYAITKKGERQMTLVMQLMKKVIKV